MKFLNYFIIETFVWGTYQDNNDIDACWETLVHQTISQVVSLKSAVN
jgi:hypothetical protein